MRRNVFERISFDFLEPALDVLWRELATLSPLLQCLSSDLWVLQKGKQSGRKELVREWI